MEEYTNDTLDHFMNPRNMGEIADADGVGEVGNMRCGDVMKVFIKVETEKRSGRETEVIKDVKFQTLGCAAAIASSSMATEMVKGKTVDEALALSKDDVNKALGILPKQKYHCSILSADAIHKAVENYRDKDKS